MNRDEALRLLRAGRIKDWNRYRTQHPDWVPDLSDQKAPADLRNAQLSYQIIGGRWRGANLRNASLAFAAMFRANMQGVDLRNADLTGALLIKANLSKADASSTNFSQTDLSAAVLTKTTLTNAVLRSARLLGTTFAHSTLRGADLEGAFLGASTFTSVDLSEVQNIPAIIHVAPSYLSVDTLTRSEPLPSDFLAACGVPLDVAPTITQLLKGRGVDSTASCFISYSSSDERFARALYSDLTARGVRCWFAPEDMKIGARIRVAIDDAIRAHEKLLLILSDASVKSQWVEQEVERALERERIEERVILFPVRVDDTVFAVDRGWAAYLRNTRNIGDFRKWEDNNDYDAALKRLLRDLS